MHNKKLLKKLALYFAEHGLPKSYWAFKSDSKKPVSDREMNNHVGSYDMMLRLFRKEHPEYWDLAQPKDLPSAVDDAADVMSKQDPLAKLRASTKEK
jgi:hypothetical protein